MRGGRLIHNAVRRVSRIEISARRIDTRRANYAGCIVGIVVIFVIDRPFKKRSENRRLPGIETDDSRADRGGIVGEEIKRAGSGLVAELYWSLKSVR